MSEISFASKIWSTNAESGASNEMSATDMNDAADFQQWLQAKPLAQSSSGDSSSSPLGEMLRSVTQSLRDREEGFDKTLKRAARTGDLVDGLAVQDRLSALYLEHGLAVKVVGKSAQALETLMRMQ